MPKYRVLSADHEISGGTIIQYRDSINVGQYEGIFTKHDLGKVDPQLFYPMQQLVDVFNDLVDRPDSMMNFVSIGMAMGENLRMPPELANMSFVDLMLGLETTYHYNNRGTDIGYMRGEQVSETHIRARYRAPFFPDDLLYGALYGYAKKFLPDGTKFVVQYDEDKPRTENGGDETIIHVKW